MNSNILLLLIAAALFIYVIRHSASSTKSKETFDNTTATATATVPAPASASSSSVAPIMTAAAAAASSPPCFTPAPTSPYVRIPQRSSFTYSQYANELQQQLAFLGGYMTDIYVHLRDQYRQAIDQPVDNADGFIPDISSPVLDDPLLPRARKTIKHWIEKENAALKRKYGDEFIKAAASYDSFDYDITPNGRLLVTVVQNGQRQTYPV